MLMIWFYNIRYLIIIYVWEFINHKCFMLINLQIYIECYCVPMIEVMQKLSSR